MFKFPTGRPAIAQIDAANVQTAFNIEWFDQSIADKGVKFIHWRAMRNPVGMDSQYDSRRSDPDTTHSSNGMLYTLAGHFSGIISGNTKSTENSDAGWVDASQASITPARFYDCNPGGQPERVYLAPADRLFLAQSNILVTQSQLVEISELGVDHLKYPACRVLDLVDSLGIRYSGTDFNLKDGNINWATPNRPGASLATNRGRTYSIRYLYQPHWYVDRLIHEIRVTNSSHPVTGARTMEQMPQSANIQREYIYRNEQTATADVNDTSGRQAPTPDDGGFQET